jgi:hypothetical protein
MLRHAPVVTSGHLRSPLRVGRAVCSRAAGMRPRSAAARVGGAQCRVAAEILVLRAAYGLAAGSSCADSALSSASGGVWQGGGVVGGPTCITSHCSRPARAGLRSAPSQIDRRAVARTSHARAAELQLQGLPFSLGIGSQP